MIYEIRTYSTRPGKVAEYEAAFAEAYPTRQKYSSLYGWWHTEIGPLNQLVHIWAYENLQQRADIRAAAGKDPAPRRSRSCNFARAAKPGRRQRSSATVGCMPAKRISSWPLKYAIC